MEHRRVPGRLVGTSGSRANDHEISGRLATFLDRLYPLLDQMPTLTNSAEIRALRFARARHVHQAASLVSRDADGPWAWRPSSHLPKPQDMRHWNDRDAADYDRLLAGQPLANAVTAAEVAGNSATA